MTLPVWRSHKEVQAFQIESIVAVDENTSMLHDRSGDYSAAVSNDFIEKHGVEVSGYYVVYSNGHESFSPADAFEAGYTLGARPRLLHIQIGSDDWEPTMEDMQSVMDMFVQASLDPKGGVVVTRAGLVHSSVETRGYLDDNELVVCSVTGYDKEQAEKEVAEQSKATDYNDINWYEVVVRPADFIYGPEGQIENTIYVNNHAGAVRAVRGRPIRKITILEGGYENLHPELKTTLYMATRTHEFNGFGKVFGG